MYIIIDHFYLASFIIDDDDNLYQTTRYKIPKHSHIHLYHCYRIKKCREMSSQNQK
jgi:hypothetical protein